MSNLDLDLDVDFNINTNDILSDYTIDQLIEELKRRGAEISESRPKHGFNLSPSLDVRTIVVMKKE